MLPKTFLDAKDGRLFPSELLYCEGLPKPLCRGMLHLFTAMILPFGMWHLSIEANRNNYGKLCAIIYISTNIFCYGVSGLYHVGKWSIQQEIFIQKLDHCGIAILSTGTMVPLTIMLLPPPGGLMFLFLSIIFCFWTCLQVFRLKPSVLAQVSVAACIVPFWPICWKYMNFIEWTTMILTCVFQSIGVYIFMHEKPSPHPEIFGHHELFHVFVVMAGVCVYLCNWSILRRTCNPYTIHTDITDELSLLFGLLLPLSS